MAFAIDYQRDDNFEKNRHSFDSYDYNAPRETQISDNSSSSCLTNEEKKQWNYNNTLLLIRTVQNHYSKMNHPKPKKYLWMNVANDMTRMNVEVTATECHKKWQNLVRTYKVCKNNINKSGKRSTRFHYFDSMDEILGEKSTPNTPTVNIKEEITIEEHELDLSTLSPIEKSEESVLHAEDSEDYDFREISHSFEDNTTQEHQFLENSSSSETAEKKKWNYYDTLHLIKSVHNRYSDMNHPEHKKYIWAHVANYLTSMNIEVNAAECYKKWRNLLRTYKVCKHNKHNTGKDSTRFQYFDALEEILGENPNILSSHTTIISNNGIREETITSEHENSLQSIRQNVSSPEEKAEEITQTEELEEPFKKKRKTNDSDVLEVLLKKRKTNDSDVLEVLLKKREVEWKIRRQERKQRHEDKCELMKRKLEIEERKIKLLEELLKQKYLQNTSPEEKLDETTMLTEESEECKKKIKLNDSNLLEMLIKKREFEWKIQRQEKKQRHEEKCELTKRKLEIEERKINVIGELQKRRNKD